MSRLQQLQARRDEECRLTPNRALDSLDEAEDFLRERGMLTRSPDGSLPSLFGAIHEAPYAPGSRGFGSWPQTKYPWSFEITKRDRVYAPKIHRGKTLYLSEETARLADPICRAEIARMEAADPDWTRLLKHLDSAGPSLLVDLQTELELKPQELKAIRSPLERCGAIVTRPVTLPAGDGHVHTTELARWDQVFTGAGSGEPDLGALVVAGVRAAVAVPEPEPRRWFSWTWRWEDDLIDRLVADGLLDRPERGWLCLR